MTSASIQALRLRHGDDRAHSDQVCRLSVELFARTLEIHGVSPRHLPLLQAGALLHNVGLERDAKRHHLVGRDIVVDEGLRGFTDEERAVVGCLVRFHRKRVDSADEPLFASLAPEMQPVALRLAAILRIADGLDYHGTQSAQIARVRRRASRLRVDIAGSYKYADADAERAENKADLWREVVGVPVRFRTTAKAAHPGAPAFDRDISCGEAAGIALRYYSAQIVGNRLGLVAVDGVETRHDVRVAIRRCREVLRLHRDLWDGDDVRRLRDDLARFCDIVGTVRDCDLALAWLDRVGLSPTDDARLRIERTRRSGLQEVVIGLRDGSFDALSDTVVGFAEQGVTVAGAGADEPLGREVHRVLRRHAKRIMQYIGVVRERDVERLHALRKDCRRMRYAAEMWYSVLGPGRRRLVRRLRAVQDALGDLHDADVHAEFYSDAADRGEADPLRVRCDEDRADAWKRFAAAWPRLVDIMGKKQIRKVCSE